MSSSDLKSGVVYRLPLEGGDWTPGRRLVRAFCHTPGSGLWVNMSEVQRVQEGVLNDFPELKLHDLVLKLYAPATHPSFVIEFFVRSNDPRIAGIEGA